MPCRDGRDEDYGQYDRYQKQVNTLEAMLCSTMRFLADQSAMDKFLTQHDDTESGVKKLEIAQWWTKHQQEDAARREQERANLEKQNLRKTALGKLSAEERRALGL